MFSDYPKMIVIMFEVARTFEKMCVVDVKPPTLILHAGGEACITRNPCINDNHALCSLV